MIMSFPANRQAMKKLEAVGLKLYSAATPATPAGHKPSVALSALTPGGRTPGKSVAATPQNPRGQKSVAVTPRGQTVAVAPHGQKSVALTASGQKSAAVSGGGQKSVAVTPKNRVPSHVPPTPAELVVPSWATRSTVLGSILVPAASFRVIEVPRDGNCLFTSMAVCRMILEKRRLGIEDVKTQKMWGEANRAQQIKWIAKQLESDPGFPTPDGPPLSTCITASTDLSGDEYCNLAFVRKQFSQGSIVSNALI